MKCGKVVAKDNQQGTVRSFVIQDDDDADETILRSNETYDDAIRLMKSVRLYFPYFIFSSLFDNHSNNL